MALVEAMDVFPTEAFASDLHPSAEGSNCRKIFNREPDCLQRQVKAKPTDLPMESKNVAFTR